MVDIVKHQEKVHGIVVEALHSAQPYGLETRIATRIINSLNRDGYVIAKQETVCGFCHGVGTVTTGDENHSVDHDCPVCKEKKVKK